MQRIVTILAVVAASLVAVVGLLWVAQRKLIYFPTHAVADISMISRDSEEVTYTSEDGLTLSAWWIPASGVAQGSTVVVFPGNAGNRSDRTALAAALMGKGYSVLLVDYRGFGGNKGNPTETGLHLDARAAVAYVASRADVDPHKLVYWGESLGAAVAIGAATETAPSALVLRSPFTSMADVASYHYPFLPSGVLLKDRYPSLDRIGMLHVPVLVAAGTADSVVPFSQSRDIFDAAQGPKRFVTIEGADHNDPELSHGSAMIDEVTTFLADVNASP